MTTVNWALIGAAAITIGLVLATTRYAIDWSTGWAAIALPSLMLAVAVYYQTWRPNTDIANALHAFGLAFAKLGVVVVLSYLAAASPWPLVDDQLKAIDVALGLDWEAYIAFFSNHPWLEWLLKMCYLSLVAQSYAAIAILVLLRKYSRMQVSICTFIIAAMLCIAGSVFMPAIASQAIAHFSGPLAGKMDPAAVFVHIKHMSELKSGAMTVIDIRNAQGIVTFPSFHTASAVILIWVFWGVPWLKWVSLAVNVIMVIATPVHGGHYFIDVFAGVAIAIASIWAALAIRRAVGRHVMARRRSSMIAARTGWRLQPAE
jgi:PAP2 superfamily